MTPERLKDLITYFKQVPIVEQEYAMECIAEIQRLQAALPTPAKEPSGELEKAVEALKWAKGYIDDGTVENDTETPQHHCDYIHNPESGHCEFHQKYSEMCEIIAAYRAQVTKEGM